MGARVAVTIGLIAIASGILAGAASTMNNVGEESPTVLMVGHIVVTYGMMCLIIYALRHIEEEHSPFMHEGKKRQGAGLFNVVYLIH